MSVDTPILSADQVVDGKYRIVKQLGQGGMGAVYEALNLGTNRRVAIKVIVSTALANEPGVIARFHREAKASGSIDSLHVVQVLDTGVDPASGNPYMVMEYLSGQDLITAVHRNGPLPPDVVVRMGAQACLGLQRAHEAGIVHRDIKSANMYLARRDGGEVQVKLLDFGIAKVRAEPVPGAGTDHGLTTTGSMIGSPLYMSPEQARSTKTLDQRADIWSLGVALYEALAGATPNHDKETLGDLLIAICVEPTPSLQARAPWVPAELARVIEKTMEKDPARRYQTAAELHAALVALAPYGTTLREEMIVPLTPQMRSYVAPRPAQAASTDPGAVAASSPGMHAPIGAATPAPLSTSSDLPLAAGITNPELGASRGAPTKSPKGAFVVMIAVAIVILGVVGGSLRLRKSRHARATEESAPTATGLVATVSSATTTPPPPSAAPSAIEKTAAVTIVAPPNAKVFVDDAPAEVRAGSVSVTGRPGSAHKIRIEHTDGSQEASVLIGENGDAAPSKVELAAKGKPIAAKPSNPATPGVAVAPAVPAKPAASKPAEPAEPGLKTTF